MCTRLDTSNSKFRNYEKRYLSLIASYQAVPPCTLPICTQCGLLVAHGNGVGYPRGTVQPPAASTAVSTLWPRRKTKLKSKIRRKTKSKIRRKTKSKTRRKTKENSKSKVRRKTKSKTRRKTKSKTTEQDKEEDQEQDN